MRFYDLFEQANTITLYRGDSSRVEKFELAKTDTGALLGIGIYLTDSPEIAKDYTVKGSNEIVFRGGMRDPNGSGYINEGEPFMSPQELTAGYLRKLLADSGFEQQMADLKAKWVSFYDDGTRSLDYSSPDWQEKREVIQQQAQNGFAEARQKYIRPAVDKAKVKFKTIRKDLRITKLTTGEYVFTKQDRTAAIAQFVVPTSYIAQCLHAERPLSDDAVAVLRSLFIGEGDPDRPFDLRILKKNGNNGDEEMGLSFDKFIDGYKKSGTRYAWTDRKMGGNGENPSLDVLLNGTHSGLNVFYNKRDVQMAMAEGFQKLGYVGLAYDGGVRLAGNGARGGGGIRHNAYVFWDEDAIHSFRVSDDIVKDDEIGEFEKGMRAKTVYR